MKISIKHIFTYWVFALFFQCQIFAQAPTSLCLDAPIMCDLNDLDGYSGTMSATPTPGPNPLCVSTVPNNMHWWGFVSTGTSISIDVLLSNCTLESGMMGANFGVYESCSFGTPVWCSDFCFDGFSTNLPITGLTVGQSYYLYMDGCNGSVCDYTFGINSGGGGVFHPNDACSGAIGLTDGISLTGGTNVCATADNDDCSNGGNTNTVWYSFTLGPSDNAASFIITSNDDGISDFNAELYTDCASSFVASNCSNADGMLVEFSCLLPNTSYFLQIGTDEINASANYEILPDFFDSGGFDSCTDPNFLGPLSCGVTLSEIENITGFCPEISDLGTTCSFSTTATAWYEFSVPPNEEIFSIINHTGPGHALFNVQCPTGSPIDGDCFVGDHNYDVSAGGTYFLAMMGDGAGDYVFDYSFNYNGGSCTLANDFGNLDADCSQVIFAGVPESCMDGNATGCMSGLNGSWHTFILTSSLGTEIEIEDLDGGSSFEIYSGVDCNNLTLVADCQLSFSATPGAQYWIFLSEASLIGITSCPCNIANVLPVVNCLDNGSTANNLDDIIEVSLQIGGISLGSSYSVSSNVGSISPVVGDYTTATVFQLQPGSAGAGDVVLTLIDDTDLSCLFSLTIPDPLSCSPDCSIENGGLTNVACDNNSTINNTSDDRIVFDLNPAGFNLGAIYSVTSSSGGISPTSGFYGETTSFMMDAGSAGSGNLMITLEDNQDNSCELEILINDPGVCSSDVGSEILYNLNTNCLGKRADINFGGTDRDRLWDVAILANGDRLYVGDSRSSDEDVDANNGGEDIWIYRWNEIDGIIWERNYGGTLDESTPKVLSLPNDEFLIGCNSFSTDGDVSSNYGDQDIWLFKIDDLGNIIWEQHFGGSSSETFSDLVSAGNDEYLIVGYTASGSNDVSNNYGLNDGWVFKIDGSGSLIWERNYGGSSRDLLFTISSGINGSFYIGGNTSSEDFDIGNQIGSGDGWIINIDQNGSLLWEESYGGLSSEQINKILFLDNGNMAFAGISLSNDGDLANNYGSWDGWAGSIDPNGNLLWSRNIGGSDWDHLWNGIEAANGVCFVGNTESVDNDLSQNYGNNDMWVVFLDFNGDLFWSQNYGGPSIDYGNKLEIIGEDTMLLLGSVVSQGNDVSNHYLLEDHWVLELAGECTRPFVTTWQTDNPGSSCNTCITIPTFLGETYNYDVDWDNDGVFDEFGLTGDASHDYGTIGTYNVGIRGDFPRIYFNLAGDREKIIAIEQWGDIEWSSMESAFAGCVNMMGNASDVPDLSNVTVLQSMFHGSSSFNQDINAWNVSTITNMNGMFFQATNFNQSLNSWDMSNVTDLINMFYEATNFNGNISDWDVSNVSSLFGMFVRATAFNGDLSNWDVSNVASMRNMFEDAISFNQSINTWNTTNCNDFSTMFFNAQSFNQPLDLWDVSMGAKFQNMFDGAIAFNQDISNWNVVNADRMSAMFRGASSFNQSLANWNLSTIINTTGFDGLENMLNNCGLSQSNYEATLNGWASNSNTPNDLELGALGLEYCDETGRNMLLNDMGWTIVGDSQNCAQQPFITTWQTDNSGASCNTCVQIPTNSIYSYNYDIDWENDGTYDEFGLTGDAFHDYGVAGTYDIAIRGDFPHLYHADPVGDNDKLLDVKQWGDIIWSSMELAFAQCDQLINFTAIDQPNLSLVTSMRNMFQTANNFNGDLSLWDVSNVEDMLSVFGGASSFNSNINTWDVSNVTDMQYMFQNAYAYNQPLDNWDVSSVVQMNNMFEGLSLFDQNINNWNVSNVEDMGAMFNNCSNYNQPLDNWNVSKVRSTDFMFINCTSFNQALDAWDVSSLETARSMFTLCEAFNSPLASWNLVSAFDLRRMLEGCTSFNQPLDAWDVSNVENFHDMLRGASSFDQTLESWNLSSCMDEPLVLDGLESLLDFTNLSEENYTNTLLGWALNPNTPDNIELGAETLEYCDETGRNELINNKGWTIIGDIKSCVNCDNFADNCSDPPIYTLSPITNTNMLDFECALGCIENATPEIGVTDCGFDFRPTAWFQLQTDASAVQTFVTVNTSCGWDPVYAVFKSSSGDCNQDLELVFSAGFPGCSINWGDPSGFSQGLEANTIYWIGVGSAFFEDGMCGDFELCVATSLIEIPCFGDGSCTPLSVNQTTDDQGIVVDPENDMLRLNESYTICEEFFYDASESGVEWLMGVVPFFEGWDLTDFDPQNVQITGNGIQASWYEGVLLQETLNNVCTYTDSQGRLQLCNTICETCPCSPPLTQGDLLPGGWYWTTSSSDCVNDGTPNTSWGIGMDQVTVEFCVVLQTPNFSNQVDCESIGQLKFGFQTFSDGVVGCWDDPVGECLIDESQFNIYTLDCSSLSQNSFISTWKTDNSGASCNTCLTIPANTLDYVYSYDIDWENDGVFDEFGITGDATHDYTTAGTYQVAIRGNYPHLFFNTGVEDNDKLISVDQWGDIEWLSMHKSFFHCDNMNILAADVPDLSQVNDMSFIFDSALSFNANVNSWDVSNVTDMSSAFASCTSFNETINAWDVSNITDMSFLFSNASIYNQSLSDWDMSLVSSTNFMFQNATAFNQDLDTWNLSSLNTMNGMFNNAENFNGDVQNWDISNVTEMGFLFFNASAFNQDLSNWNVSSVFEMSNLFNGASSFDQSIGNWNLSSLSGAESMLDNCGLSVENYESTLLAWSQNPNTPNAIDLGALNLVYCDEEGRNQLINDLAWTIAGDSQDPACDCPMVDAGGSNPAEYCQGQGSVDLFAQMFNFDNNGRWEDPLATGLALTNPFLVDVGSLDEGDYFVWYIVGDVACPMDTNVVNFTIHPMYEIPQEETICFGEIITVGTETFDATGMYDIVLKTIENCDSTIQLDLTVLPEITSNRSVSGCPGDIYLSNGESFVFADVGPYEETQILESLEFPGCDSLLIITMNIKDDIEVDFTGFICGEEQLEIGGMTFDKEFPNGDISVPSTNFCDSLIRVDLTHVDSIQLVGGSTNVEGNILTLDLLEDAIYDPQLNYTIEPINIDTDKILNIESTTSFGIFDIEFFPNVESIVSIEFEMCHETCNICDTVIWNVNKTITGYTELVVTCNGDGVNDRLIMSEFIENLEIEFPCNKIIIFNRWGQPVYEAQPYANDWCGTYMNTDKPIPEGSYYFTLDLVSPDANCASDSGNVREFIFGVITLLR